MATLPKSNSNKSPVQKPQEFGEVFHYDIVHGAGTAIGGYRYVLWLVDRASRYIFEYPLKSLKETELLRAVKLFKRDLG
eukprot:347976-Ditylum_brightwellii.AAC.1